jgi:hypothetical protein
LRRAGLVEARRQGKWSHYRLKKQPPKLQRILTDALAAISDQPQIARDLQRAKQIQCSPSRFGLSSMNGTSAK